MIVSSVESAMAVRSMCDELTANNRLPNKIGSFTGELGFWDVEYYTDNYIFCAAKCMAERSLRDTFYFLESDGEVWDYYKDNFDEFPVFEMRTTSLYSEYSKCLNWPHGEEADKLKYRLRSPVMFDSGKNWAIVGDYDLELGIALTNSDYCAPCLDVPLLTRDDLSKQLQRALEQKEGLAAYNVILQNYGNPKG